jgi:hypothetical protein
MTTETGIPKTKNKVIKELFNQATSDIELVKNGKKVPEGNSLLLRFRRSRRYL